MEVSEFVVHTDNIWQTWHSLIIIHMRWGAILPSAAAGVLQIRVNMASHYSQWLTRHTASTTHYKCSTLLNQSLHLYGTWVKYVRHSWHMSNVMQMLIHSQYRLVIKCSKSCSSNTNLGICNIHHEYKWDKLESLLFIPLTWGVPLACFIAWYQLPQMVSGNL